MPNSYPPKPNFSSLNSTADRQRIFGKFQYKAKPIAGNRENIVILGDWQAKNVVKVIVPQLIGVRGAPRDGGIYFHKLGVNQLLAMFAEWERAGLMHLVKTWGGAFVARFIRGSLSILSNHAFATAFDINVPWNPLGRKPAPRGAEGSVVDLVEIANKCGFYWGGHFDKRPDGMHFELAQLLGPAELNKRLQGAQASAPAGKPPVKNDTKQADASSALAPAASSQNERTEEEPSLTDSLIESVPAETIKSTAGKIAGHAAKARKGWVILRPFGLIWAALEAGNFWAWAGVAVLVIGLLWIAYSHRSGIMRIVRKLLARIK